MTHIYSRPTGKSGLWLKQRLLAVLVAICTYPMRWFGAAHGFLHRVSQRPIPKLLQFVALLLTAPIFQASNFFFNLAYLLNERRAFLLSRERARLSVKDLGLKFDGLGLKGGSVPQTYHRLRNILGSLERRHKRR